MKRQLLAAVVLALGLQGAVQADDKSIPYPTGYRDWTHVKSMAIVSDRHPLSGAFGGIHHVYVNRAGLAAAKAHGNYPDGSVLVFDLLRAEEADGAYSEGARKLVAVMQKNARRFKTTGGWGFQAFKAGNPADPVVTDPVGQCFNCHQSQSSQDFVFSRIHD